MLELNVKEVILLGNPFDGKTTLFNSLTKSNEHTGNWHGVTVGVKERNIKLNGDDFKFEFFTHFEKV